MSKAVAVDTPNAIRLSDYSLVGKDTSLAIERGLAEATWYTSPVSNWEGLPIRSSTGNRRRLPGKTTKLKSFAVELSRYAIHGIRSMARHAGVSKSHVQSIWSRNDIKPHVRRTFKLSRDPNFEPKFWDIIGLYLNPPHKAVVLCCDEKSQCQALERTQPGLPLGIGHICRYP